MLDKNSVIPIYYQLMQYIKGQIDAGVWNVGDMIPAERALCVQFHISRMTVRQAIDTLKKEGVLYCRRGIGTFIGSPKMHQRLRKLTSFTEDMQQRGLVAGSKTLSLKVEVAPAEVADALGIEKGARVVVLKRLRLANGEPMSLETSFLIYDMIPDFEGCYRDGASLYQTLGERYGLNIVFARQTIACGLCGKQEAKLLKIRENAPVFRICRTGMVYGDKPLEYVWSVYRADRYVFTVELSL